MFKNCKVKNYKFVAKYDADDSFHKSPLTHVFPALTHFDQGHFVQDSFAEFTLEQVSQYMKNDKIRSKHQQTLLELREEAVKERTEAKLQWLDIKKK